MLCAGTTLLSPPYPCVTSGQDVYTCWGAAAYEGGRRAFKSWMSDRGEHLSGKHTSRQLIHYSLNGGIIQTGDVCIHTCICVCVCGQLMLAFFMTHAQVKRELETYE